MHMVKKTLCLLLALWLVFAFAACSSQNAMADRQVAPVNLAVQEQRAREQKQGDIYVSPSGSDENPGTKEQPVQTPQRAVELARALDKAEKVIYFADGEYRISALTLTAEDSGITFFAENGAKRVVPLAVSAPSHCPMMQSAADKLKEALSSITLKDAAIPVYCNAYAKPLTAKDEIVKALILQLVGPVRWVECVKAMQSDGVSALIECGPGKVLCGLNRKIDKSLDLANICDEDSLNKAIELIK